MCDAKPSEVPSPAAPVRRAAGAGYLDSVQGGPAAAPASDERVLVLPELRLESGRTLRLAPVAYRTWGTLRATRDNAIVVNHALTGDTAADVWWSDLVGPGKVLDTDRFFVVCANILGSPYGSVSPPSVDPDTGRPYGPTFPDVTIRDTVAAHRQVLEHLGVRRVALAIGGSMGGMLALEWAYHRDLVRAIAVVAAGGHHSPWSIAWGEAQRQAIFADPAWKGGAYTPDAPPASGLSVARMMAMVSYRSSGEFRTRFGRATAGDPAGAAGGARTAGGDAAGAPGGARDAGRDPVTTARFEVESYLHHQGKKLNERFDANCYVQLTRQMDTHDVGRGRGGYEEALDSLPQPALVVGIPSDVLYPIDEQAELASLLPGGQLEVLSSRFGHDGFLVDSEALAEILGSFVRRYVY